ncbi:hypothetical protein [Polaromonas sp. SM01]|uniref:hypothetical protein n=1 Tax=Polaromonas sp. SM01 TaxID=3085630 RepID=UPI0029819174|nr:hypothetical protein [Polaromonas sp. SM01]MDW5441698.1 hypothetical protein [Polaromonas sp. SM01]
MSLFENLFSPSRAIKDGRSGPETGPVQMSLEERMAFRREMLFDSINSTMKSWGMVGGSYRFKVVRVDKRGHTFAVMVDLSTDFLRNEQGRQEPLAALGAAIKKNALSRYGLGVPAVYWRVNEELKGLDAPRSGEGVRAEPASARSSRSSDVRRYERATAEELAAFEAAWQKSSQMTIGDRTYASDLAPLGDLDNGKDSR